VTPKSRFEMSNLVVLFRPAFRCPPRFGFVVFSYRSCFQRPAAGAFDVRG